MQLGTLTITSSTQVPFLLAPGSFRQVNFTWLKGCSPFQLRTTLKYVQLRDSNDALYFWNHRTADCCTIFSWYLLTFLSPPTSCAIEVIRPKLILNPNLVKYRSFVTSVSVVQSFWNYTQSTAVSLSRSVHNFKTIGVLCNKLWANELSRDLGLRRVLDGYSILHWLRLWM